jgi:CheY-like chemotaxis protein
MNADPAVRLTVLYIEDNASNLQLVKRIFRDRQDIDLRSACRGQEGIDMARETVPGLILLDLHLPDMPGTEVLSSLRSDPATASIAVVVVSADATLDQIKLLRDNGVADYVTKPFEVPRLVSVVESFMAPPSAAPGAPGAAAGADTAPSANGDLILDPARVAELHELDADGSTFRSLAAVALDEAADHIAAISQAPAAGDDATAVSAAAHGLKSSATIVGASRLASLADAVEQAARAGSLPDSSVLSELRQTLTVTRQATIDAIGQR